MTSVGFLDGYAKFLEGYATARLGPGKHQRGFRRIFVEVAINPDRDEAVFTLRGFFYRKGDATTLELAPINICREDVEDNRAPELLDERLALWRAAADAPPPQTTAGLK